MAAMYKIITLLLILGCSSSHAGDYYAQAKILDVQPNFKYIYRDSGKLCPYPKSLNRELCRATPDGFNVIYRYNEVNHYIHSPHRPAKPTLKIHVGVRPVLR